MSKTSGTQVQIGLGIESLAAPGVAVAEAIFVPWQEFSMQGISEKEMFNSARGLRNMSSNSMIRRKYGQGSVGFIPNVMNFPYFIMLALGGVSSSTVSDSAYTHTFSVQNTNSSVRSATLTIEEGGIQTVQYTNAVINSLNFEVSDGYAKATAEFISKFPSTDTISESYAQETEFAYHQYTAKFGTSLSNAGSQDATPLKSFSLNINNNILLDEAFLSGSNEPANGSLIPSRLEITGSYSLHFTDTTELNKYKNNTKNALIVTFEGALIGSTSKETIQFKLGRLVLTSAPVEYNIDGILILNQEFTVEYEATDKELEIVVINDVNNASSTTYNPA